MKQETITPSNVFETFNIALQNGDVETVKSTLSGWITALIEDISLNQKLALMKFCNLS
jgi:hypothetical protein